MTTDLVQCPYCGERHEAGEPVVCCGETGHCFPVTQATLDEEARERDEGLRDAAIDARLQEQRERRDR